MERLSECYEKELAVVVGATGGQGGSVVDKLLESGRYKVRGITRNRDSRKSRILANRGVQMEEADLDDPKALLRVFFEAHAIFAVTVMVNGDMNKEIRQGKNIADAAANTEGLKHFVWSTLPSATRVSNARYPAPHMDGKAEVDEYILNSLPGLARKTTFFWGGFYAENVQYPNFISNFLASAERHVWLQPVQPETLIPMIGDHHHNVGIIVERIFAQPDRCLPSRYVLGVTEWISNGELLEAWAKTATGHKDHYRPPVYVHSTMIVVDQLWPQGGQEIGMMLKLLEALGEKAWSKDGIQVITLQELGLRIGETEADLMSTRNALRRMAGNVKTQQPKPER